MVVNIASSPGNEAVPNEDWAVVSLDTAIVLDGVSAPAGDTGCDHGTPWFVRELGGFLSQYSASDDHSLSSALGAAIGSVAELHSGTCDLSHPGTPSATVAMVRLREGELEYLSLADSVIIFESSDGPKVISDSRVENVVNSERDEALKYPVGSHEHAKLLQIMIEKQRQLRNIVGGYWVAQSNPNAADHALTGRIPLEPVRSVAVMSDGVSRIVNLYEKSDWSSLFSTLRDAGVGELLRQIRMIEDSDPEGARWPRYKKSDDATIVHWELESHLPR